jgi:phosphoserine phosphatase
VLFDCDSTLTAVEGIAELARAHRTEIARLTERAMNGEIPLEAVYARRLDLIRPSRSEVTALGNLYVDRMVPGARDVIRRLRECDIDVWIVSGGLRPAVLVLGRALGLDEERVAGVDIEFDAQGGYAAFDTRSPLARSGGKLEWVRRHDAALAHPRLLVGDGATDLEARPALDAFVAFTGVVRRAEVLPGADLVIEGPTLDPLLDMVLGEP